jgi:endonuclease-8
VRSVDAHGKNLFIRFDNGLTIHSHLRMTGKWRTRPADWRTPRNTWLILRRGTMLVAQINGPVLELMTDSRTRFDRRLAMLGPDILAPELDEAGILRRLREDDPTRPIGDSLLDQRILAGIGNLWKVEGCFDAEIDPWRRTGDVSDEEVLTILRRTRPRMQQSARDGMQQRFKLVYGTAGQDCPRCGKSSKIRSRGQGDDNRITYWCPRCQR